MQDAPATKKDIQKLDGRLDAMDAKFDAVDQRFEAIDRKFDAVDQRFEAIDRKFEAIDRKFDAIDRRFDAIDHRFDGVDRKIENLDAKLDARTHLLAVEIVKTNQRMDRMEEGLRQEMRQLNSQVLTALDASVGRMETLWRESALIPRVLDEHGATLRDHESRLGRLESPGQR